MTDTVKGEPDVTPLSESVLQEAQRLIHGDRGAFYGPPGEDFAKTAKMISGLLLPKLTSEVTTREAILIMVLVKCSREVNRPKRDNAVDIAGYAGLLEMIGEGDD